MTVYVTVQSVREESLVNNHHCISLSLLSVLHTLTCDPTIDMIQLLYKCVIIICIELETNVVNVWLI